MVKTTLRIEGMACGMCEAHICDTIRKTVPGAKKVSASHSKDVATFLSETAPDEDELRKAIDATGYTFCFMETEPYEKKKLFGR